MNTHIRLIFIATLFVLTQTSCKKLPNETSRGRNILACYVNEKKYVARGILCIGGLVCLGSKKDGVNCKIKNDTILTIIAKDKKNNSDEIKMIIENFKGIGDYVLFCYADTVFSDPFCIPQANYDSYCTDSVHIGILKVKTFDGAKKIIAGTFEFEAFSYYKNEVIKITSGRFDIEYSSY